MGILAAYGLLLVAACLEAGGDALVRLGLHNHQGTARIGLFFTGAAVLFVYGLSVNAPPSDFGRLLGVYVTLFFVVAQVLNFFVFGAKPDLPILVGGALIVTGGVLMTVWRPVQIPQCQRRYPSAAFASAQLRAGARRRQADRRRHQGRCDARRLPGDRVRLCRRQSGSDAVSLPPATAHGLRVHGSL